MSEAPELTPLQAAYNDGIEAAKNVIRDEVLDDYWRPVAINAIARRTNPYAYDAADRAAVVAPLVKCARCGHFEDEHFQSPPFNCGQCDCHLFRAAPVVAPDARRAAEEIVSVMMRVPRFVVDREASLVELSNQIVAIIERHCSASPAGDAISRAEAVRVAESHVYYDPHGSALSSAALQIGFKLRALPTIQPAAPAAVVAVDPAEELADLIVKQCAAPDKDDPYNGISRCVGCGKLLNPHCDECQPYPAASAAEAMANLQRQHEFDYAIVLQENVEMMRQVCIEKVKEMRHRWLHEYAEGEQKQTDYESFLDFARAGRMIIDALDALSSVSIPTAKDKNSS